MPATEQWRTDHVFATPSGFAEDYASVVAPSDASIEIDGVAIEGLGLAPWTEVGQSGHVVIRVPLDPGAHRITGDAAFGVELYGYGQASSYWLPTGLLASAVAP